MKKKKAVRRSNPKRIVDSKKQTFSQQQLPTFFLLLILIFVSVIRLRLLNVPIERDEGEYAYFAQLLLDGIPPYEMAYSMKFPGIYFIYAFFMLLFGQSVMAIHLGLLIANLTTIVFLYLLVKELVNDFAGLATATAFGVLALNDGMFGFAAHATHFVILVAIPGFYYLFRAYKVRRSRYYIVAGILLGLVPLFKQSGIFFSIMGGVMCLVFWLDKEKPPLNKRVINLGWFIFGGLAPSVLMFVFLLAAGVFDRFWFWTIQYPFAYGGQVTFERGMDYLTDNFGRIIDGFEVIWVLIAAGIPLLFFTKFRINRMIAISFLLLFLVMSFLPTVPGFYFRPHYFVTIMPVAAVLAGITISYLSGIVMVPMQPAVQKSFAFLILVVTLGFGIGQNNAYYFKEDPEDISRRIYGMNPFVESEAIGDFIRHKTKPEDKVVVFGSEPQIYFFAERKSATGFIYMYPMMEDHEFNLQMQEQMISEIEAADPEILVFADISVSWLRKSHSPNRIFSWMMETERSGKYKMIGAVEIYSDATLYKFTEVAMKNQPKSKFRVRIYKKIS